MRGLPCPHQADGRVRRGSAEHLHRVSAACSCSFARSIAAWYDAVASARPAVAAGGEKHGKIKCFVIGAEIHEHRPKVCPLGHLPYKASSGPQPTPCPRHTVRRVHTDNEECVHCV